MVKVAIVGSKCELSKNRIKRLGMIVDRCLERLPNVEIVSGGAMGIDHFAEVYAFDRDYNLSILHADWKTHGTSAGVIRNKALVEYSDKFIVFHDDKLRGTANVIKLIQAAKKPYRLFTLDGTVFRTRD